uniref:Si:dkey-243i1.1 n=1 Tax=Neogobius melanostomus TaxID=47308 RepID=A0A8C6TFE6_9GOBI
MAEEYLQSSPRTSHQKGWIVVNSNINDNRELSVSKTGTKLLFNEAVPTCTSNRATCVDPPTSIVIEKLLPVPEERNLPDSTKSSISFIALSEERLNAAVKLAKRDLRTRRLDSLNKSPQKHTQTTSLLETSDVELLQELGATPSKVKLKASSPKEQKAKPRGRFGRASYNRPLNREPGSQENSSLHNEILRLQNELEMCIQKVVEQTSKEQKSLEPLEPLEPDEQSKLNIRKEKQAARSASVIYALKHQVKELQENLQQEHFQKIKSTSLQRLAAAHRGALRALHGFIQQLSDSTHYTHPPNFKDLGQLIRQLCLCSAKVELNKGSAMPQSALSILQKLETLDSALCKQTMLKKMQVPTCPPPRESHRGANAFDHQAACKPKNAAKNIKGKKKASRKSKSVSYDLTYRRDVLRAGVERLAQQGVQRNKDVASLRDSNKAVHPEKVAPLIKAHNSILQPTVSSRLRVNQLPQRERSVPWIPTSPHSPPRQRPLKPKTRPEPRCLFPPEKSPQCPPKAKVANKAEPSLNSEKEQQAQDEAMRSEVMSPTRWAEGPEQKATEIIQPLQDQAHQFDASRNTTVPSLNNRLIEHVAQGCAESAEQLSEALLEDLLEDTVRAAWAVETDRQLEGNAQNWAQTSTLENMLLRMEEMQRDQEEVRRRVTSIIYSDPLSWNKSKDTGKDSGSRPCSPQPIRLTRPVLRQSPAAEIILEKPLETGVFMENSLTEAEVFEVRSMFPVSVQSSRGAVLSVPSRTLRSIRQYREDYEAYCRSVALKTTGGVTSWAIADSLAEELLAEALTVVAAEFQDVVEEYAEAVFTSEFLQPVQSPTPSAQTIT